MSTGETNHRIPSIRGQVEKQLREVPTLVNEFPRPYIDRLPEYATELRLWNDSLYILDLNYQTASEEEKNFIALHDTFVAARARIQSGNIHKRSLLPFIASKINDIHVNEIERLHEPVHPLLEIALEAWKNRPLHAHTQSEHDIEHQLHGMLRHALLETQHHIEHTKDKQAASEIIIQTQHAIINAALDLAYTARETGDESIGKEVEGMLTLAFNLTAEKDEVIHLRNGKINSKQIATFAERVLYDPVIIYKNNDPKTQTDNQYTQETSGQIDFIGAFEKSIGGNTGDVSKTVRKYIHERAIKLPQQLLFVGIASEQALQDLSGYIKDHTGANEKYILYDFVQNVKTGKPKSAVEYVLQHTIALVTDNVDQSWMRETPVRNDAFVGAIEKQLQFAIARKSTLVEVMANMVKRKLPIEQSTVWRQSDVTPGPSDELTHAGKVAEELFDHMASSEFIGSLRIPAKQLKDQLGGRLKAFKDFFTESHRRGQYLKTLLAFNPKGARLHVSLYKDSLISVLVDGGRKAPHGLSASHAQAISGSIAGHWNALVQPISGMNIVSKAFSTDAAEQMKKVLNAYELRNSRHALSEIVSPELLQIPSIAVIPENMDPAEMSALNKVYASYIIEQIEREQKMWIKHNGEITADMWEFQRFMLNLLAEEESFELNGVKYVPNTELHNMIAAKVIKLTLDNIQFALSQDTGEKHTHFDTFMEVLEMTIPFMPIATRKHFVQRYALEALNFAGDFVTDGKWKQFCYTIGFWNPALLPGLKGTHINIGDVKGDIPVIQDTELAQTLVDETIKLASGWKHINGITSMQLLAELESMHARSQKVEQPVTHLKKSALAQFIDVVRNFSTYDKKGDEDKTIPGTATENYKNLFETVKDAVMLTIMRRFKADIPRDPTILENHIMTLENRAKRIGESIKKGEVRSVQSVFENLKDSLKEFQDAITALVPSAPPFDQSKALLESMVANNAPLLTGGTPLSAQALEIAARVSGEEVSGKLVVSLAKQIEHGMGAEGMSTEVKRALTLAFGTFGAQLTLEVQKSISYLSKLKALSTLHGQIAKLRSIADEQTVAMADYIAGVSPVDGYAGNPALRALEFYNHIAPIIGYPRISLDELILRAWTESDQALYPEKQKAHPKKISSKKAEEKKS